MVVYNQAGSSQGQELKRGFLEHLARHDLPWRPVLLDDDQLPRMATGSLPKPAAIDAVVGFIPDAIAAAVAERGIAIASPRSLRWLRSRYPGLPVAHVAVDEAAVARVAAEHLRDQGFRHAAGIGGRRGSNPWRDRRLALFAAACEAAGLSADTYHRPVELGLATGDEYDAVLVDWLRHQPRPLAAFFYQDRSAWWFAQVCSLHGIRVPEEVAILGVDDDAMLCTASGPPLSSVIVPWRWIGARLGLQLQRLFAGVRALDEPTCRPCAVRRRASTDLAPRLDPLIARARRELARRAPPPTVAELARRLGISRRQLHARFDAALGCGPKRYLQRERLARARELLMTTAEPCAAIAARLGFRSYPSFSAAFKAEMGLGPRAFRERA